MATRRQTCRSALALTLAVLVTAFALLGTAVRPALAAAAPSAVVEPLPSAPVNSTALYDRYPLEAYTVDEGDYGSGAAARQAHNTVNLLMVSRAWLVKLSARVAEQALTFRPAAALTVTAEQLATEVTTLFWPRNNSFPAPLVVAALAAAGLWGLLQRLRGRSGAAWRTLIGSVLVLVIAGATLVSLERMLATLGEFSHELSRLSFTAATRPLGTAQTITTPIQTAGNQAWRWLVLDPWVAAEFTTPAAANLYRVAGLPGAAILELPASTRRSHYLTMSSSERERRFAPWSESRLPVRMLTAGTSLIGAAGWALGVLVLAGGLLVYDLLLLLLAVVTPLVALLALWPGLGPRLAATWGTRLIGAALGKVAAGLVLGLFLTLSVGLFNLAESGGWPLAALFQWLLLIAVIHLRLYSPARIVAGAAWLWQTGAATVRTEPGGIRGAGAGFGPGRHPAGLSALTAAPLQPMPVETHSGPPRPSAVLAAPMETVAAPTAGAQFAAELHEMQALLAAAGAARPPGAPRAATERRGDDRAPDREGEQMAVLNSKASRPIDLVRTVSVEPETLSAHPDGVKPAHGAGGTSRAGGPAAAERSGISVAPPRPHSGADASADRPPGLLKS